MKRAIIGLIAIGAFALLGGCASSGQIEVTEAWARAATAGDNSAVYFVIDNPTRTEDTLKGASTDAAEHAELHRSQMDEAGTMMMQPQSSVPVPAQGSVEFAPGGLHVMLIGLKQDLQPGDELKVNLQFEKAGQQQVTAEVRAP